MRIKRWTTGLLCVGALFAIFYIMDQAAVLPGLENVEALGHALGIWSLLPPLLAVGLAFLTGDVIVSLLVGVLAGAAMLTALDGGGMFYDTFHRVVVGIIDTSSNREKVQVILLCVAVGGMEGVSTDEFHRFGVLWDETGYTFFADGVEDGKVTEYPTACPEFILISTEVKGYRQPGHAPVPEAYEAVGDTFLVDYVRVFEKR